MKMISKTALAAALFVGAGGIVVAQPALAKDQDKQAAAAPAAPQLKLSEDFRKVAAPAQTALNAGDLATAETGITASEAAAKTDDERYVAQQLRLALVAKQQTAAGTTDAAGMARSDAALAAPLDALLNNPSTPAADRGKYAYMRGSIAFNQRKFPDAVTYYTKAQQAGYQDPDMALQIVKAKTEGGDVAGGIAALDGVVKQDEASGQKAPENLYRYAIAKLYKTNDRATLLNWVQRWLVAYPSSKNWRDAIVAFGFQGPTAAQMGKPEKMDLYRLMSVTGALADKGDYLEYAQYANDLGLPDEAKTVLAKGKADGKIPAGDSNAGSLTKLAANGVASEGSLASLATKAASSAKGDLASQTADAYLGQGNYTKAIELYKLALQKGVAKPDLVNLHLGIAEGMSGDKAAASANFAAVQTEPTKDVATLWQTWASGSAAAAPAAPQG
ncbi:hypothetical protein EAH87_02710 [Sphingomonas koreensis]|nr:hypothetical protein EAH87_02710 [Sphingomonas koreensis]